MRTVTEDSLLAAIGIVPQEALLFSGTVRDNIRYGQPSASEEQVTEAARAAQAHDFITELEQGYDSRVSSAAPIFRAVNDNASRSREPCCYAHWC